MRFNLAVLSVSLWLGITSPAYAYLDPGTGSILLQGLICAVAGGLFMIKVYWQKLKTALGYSQDASKGGTEISDQA